MNLKYYPVKIECSDDGELVFNVITFDEAVASVELHQKCYTVASWRETAQAIEKALIMLELEVHGE
jgi:hypothetical protein